MLDDGLCVCFLVHVVRYVWETDVIGKTDLEILRMSLVCLFMYVVLYTCVCVYVCMYLLSRVGVTIDAGLDRLIDLLHIHKS
jgi:hypothetical protein